MEGRKQDKGLCSVRGKWICQQNTTDKKGIESNSISEARGSKPEKKGRD